MGARNPLRSEQSMAPDLCQRNQTELEIPFDRSPCDPSWVSKMETKKTSLFKHPFVTTLICTSYRTLYTCLTRTRTNGHNWHLCMLLERVMVVVWQQKPTDPEKPSWREDLAPSTQLKSSTWNPRHGGNSKQAQQQQQQQLWPYLDLSSYRRS